MAEICVFTYKPSKIKSKSDIDYEPRGMKLNIMILLDMKNKISGTTQLKIYKDIKM